MSQTDLVELQELLELSIANRQADQLSGIFPAIDPGHVARIADEQALLALVVDQIG